MAELVDASFISSKMLENIKTQLTIKLTYRFESYQNNKLFIFRL